MENNEVLILEECPMCRGNGMIQHEGGWNVQVECADCGSHTVYVEYENDAEKAEALLKEDYLIKTVDVVGVKINDEPGRLTSALDVLDKSDINVEYLYAFMARTEKHAYVVLRVADNEAAEKALVDAGFKLITEADVCKL